MVTGSVNMHASISEILKCQKQGNRGKKKWKFKIHLSMPYENERLKMGWKLAFCCPMLWENEKGKLMFKFCF